MSPDNRGPRPTIGVAMALILLAALGLAMLREPSAARARLVVAADLAALAALFVMALLARGEWRAFAFGALIAGGVVLFLAEGPGAPARWRESLALADRDAVRDVHQAIAARRPPLRDAIRRDDFDASYSAWAFAHPNTEVEDVLIGEPAVDRATIVYRERTLAPFVRTLLGLGVALAAIVGGRIGLAVARRSPTPFDVVETLPSRPARTPE